MKTLMYASSWDLTDIHVLTTNSSKLNPVHCDLKAYGGFVRLFPFDFYWDPILMCANAWRVRYLQLGLDVRSKHLHPSSTKQKFCGTGDIHPELLFTSKTERLPKKMFHWENLPGHGHV